MRATLAVLFGFMSLAHGPVMAFAKVGPSAPAQARTAGIHARHHHHVSAEHQHPSAPQAHEDTATCYSAGCFAVVAPVPIAAPALSFSLLGQLRAVPARALVPVYAGPDDPPPRLQG